MRRYLAKVAGQQAEVSIAPDADRCVVGTTAGSRTLDVVYAAGSGVVHWLDGARVVNAFVERGRKGQLVVTIDGVAMDVDIEDAVLQTAVAQVSETSAKVGPVDVRAPMSGRVLKVMAAAGETIKAGSTLFVIEAMKMENEIPAPRDGKVAAGGVAEGAAVEVGQLLVRLDEG